MSDLRPARPRPRRIRSSVLTLLVVAALTVLLGCRSLASAPWSASTDEQNDALGIAGGELPDGVTVFDVGYPAIAHLDPALRDALRRASTAARSDGVELDVNSGWRSRAYQEQLFEAAVRSYGSRAEAARWVATPATSAHVSGDAVDIGGTEATDWLSEHGARYGLCEVYLNERWHYELRPDAVDHECPPEYADPTHDPRMRQ
jgi:D-alanyl-D-alanine carboxypeptidase